MRTLSDSMRRDKIVLLLERQSQVFCLQNVGGGGGAEQIRRIAHREGTTPSVVEYRGMQI